MESIVKERTFVCCTDGSEKARQAFEGLVEEFLSKIDTIRVLMITDCKKVYLADQYSPQNVQDTYRNFLISRVHSSKYTINFEERNHKFDDPKEQLASTVSRLSGDYCFMGNFGRKGDKSDKFRVGATVRAMISRTKAFLNQIKSFYARDKNKTKGYNFACCIDGSKKSLETLSYAKDLARNPRDKIYAVSIEDPNDPVFSRERTKEVTEAVTKSLNLKVEHLWGPKAGELGDSLKVFLEEHPDIVFDFACLGSMGNTAEKQAGYNASKLASSMMIQCCLNVLLVP